MVIAYVTFAPFVTKTGSFLCLYVAVVPPTKVSSEISGSLVFKTFWLSIFVMYFLKAKSNILTGSSSGVTSNNAGMSIFSIEGFNIGCSWLFVVEAHKVKVDFL